MKNLIFKRWSEKIVLLVIVSSFYSLSYGIQKDKSTCFIEGFVLDSKSIPITGASISEEKSNRGTVSGNDGSFSLAVKKGSMVKITYLGYIEKEIKVDRDMKNVNITLSEDTKALNEVVVVGYGTQKKVNLTGAVDQIGEEVFKDRPLSNVAQMLQGVIPNLNIIPADGKPTRNPSFNIRGNTSIGQGGNALVLIDGVEGDPSSLNPNDITSVSVLKDAAASAIYGSKGTFGVVLITTKAPQKGKISINYTTNLSIEQPTTLPNFVTDGYIYASHFYEAYNSWFNYSSVPAKLNKTQIFTTGWLNTFKQRKSDGNTEEVTVDANGNYIYYGNQDYYKALIKNNTFVQNHNLSLSGSNDKVDYYLSGRYYDYNGLYKINNTDRYNVYDFTAKGGIQLTNWLKVYNNLFYSYNKYHDPQTGGEGGDIWRNIADEGHPSAPIYNPDGTLSYSAAYTVGQLLYGKNGVNSTNDNLRNTVGFNSQFFNNTFRIKGDFTYTQSNADYTKVEVPVPYSVTKGTVVYLQTAINDKLYKNARTGEDLYSNLYGEYEKTLGNHYVKGLVGWNYEQATFDSTSVMKNGLLNSNTDNLNLALGNNVTANGTYNQFRTIGFFFRGNYAFMDKYLFEINGRYDGSSKFPTNQQWGFFPSFSAGWRVSKEAFWKVDPNILNDLKIRVSYGSLGNGNISPYSYLQQYSIFTSGRVLGGQLNPETSAPGVIPNNLTWETARTSNLGIDLSALDNRLTLTADGYIRKTLNMYTVGQTLPDIFGTTSPKGNYADMTTRGYELSLQWSDRFHLGGKAFNYSFRATLADYKTKIDKYNNSTGLLYDYYNTSQTYYAGETLGEIWGYVTKGLFQSQAEIDQAPSQTLIHSSNSGKVYPGDIRFEDLNGDGVINYGSNTLKDHGDLKIIGNTQPRYIYSFSSNFSWNNLFLSAFFQGVGKQNWYPSSECIFWGQYNRPYNNLPAWQLNNIWSTTNPNAYLPRYAGYNTSLKTPQTRYLQNVAYIRLKNLQIGYDIPRNIVSQIHLQAVNVSLSGENIWTWSPLYKWTRDLDVANIGLSDPDISTGNGDGQNYPTMKSVSFNLSVTF